LKSLLSLVGQLISLDNLMLTKRRKKKKKVVFTSSW